MENLFKDFDPIGSVRTNKFMSDNNLLDSINLSNELSSKVIAQIENLLKILKALDTYPI